MRKILPFKAFFENKNWFTIGLSDKDYELYKDNLSLLDNDDLTPDGIIEKLNQLNIKNGGVDKWLYDVSAEKLKKSGYIIPKEIKILD